MSTNVKHIECAKLPFHVGERLRSPLFIMDIPDVVQIFDKKAAQYNEAKENGTFASRRIW